MALVHDLAHGPFGGVPALIRIDRGLDFAAEAIRDALAALVIDCHRLPGHTPHRKGKIERLHRTIEQTLLCGLPGYTDGPRDVAGRLYGPIGDSPAARVAAAADAAPAGRTGTAEPSGPLCIERFAAQFAAWVAWYNTERGHTGLDGQTPLAAWNADPSPVARIDAERVRHLLLAGVERTVEKDGIHFHRLRYLAPQIQGRVGQRVHVRYMPHDDRSVEVYLDGLHLCTAYPAGQLTAEQTAQFRQHARDETRRLSTARRKASRRARTELVPLTGTRLDGTAPEQPDESRLVPADRAAEHSRHQHDRVLASRSRTDLLGLTDPTAPVAPIDLDTPDSTLNSGPDRPGQER
jgi:putative transposase